MDEFFKISACALVALLLITVLSKQGRELSLVLTVAVCCMVAVCALGYLHTVVDFLKELETVGRIDPDMITVLLKATGIVLLGEITANLCQDAGNSAISKGIMVLTSAVILWLSIPLFRNLMKLIEEILVSI